jgi:hypothetical protein
MAANAIQLTSTTDPPWCNVIAELPMNNGVTKM